MQRLTAASGAILMALVIGCGTGTPSSVPSPSPATPVPSGARTLEAGLAEAGTYTMTRFQPRLTLHIDDGWLVLFPDDDDEFALEDLADKTVFYGSRVAQVVDPGSGVGDAPDDLVAWLVDHPDLEASAPAATTVDTLPATSIDVTNEDTTDTDLFAFPTGNFHIPPGVRLRFIVVPMDGPDLVIYTGGPIDRFDAAIARTQPMLESLRVGD